VKAWLRLSGSLAILLAALYLLDWGAVRGAVQKISGPGLVWAFGITMLHFLVLGWRWNLIVQQAVPRPVLDHLGHYFLASFLNSFTPANLGGDLYRVLLLRTYAPDGKTVIIAVLRERYLGLLSYLLAAVFLLALVYLGKPAAVAGITPLLAYTGFAAAVGVIVLLAAPPLLRRLAGDLEDSRWPLVARGVKMLCEACRIGSVARGALLLLYSLAGVALWVLAVKLVANDMELPLGWPAIGSTVVLTELLRMLPVTIQGIGLREATFAYLLGLLGSSPESGFVVGAVSYVILTCALLACGVLGWILLQIKSHQNE